MIEVTSTNNASKTTTTTTTMLTRGDSGSSTHSQPLNTFTDDQRFIDINIDSDNDDRPALNSNRSTTTTNIFNFNKPSNSKSSSKPTKTRELRGAAPTTISSSSSSSGAAAAAVSSSSSVGASVQKKPFNLILSNFNEVNLYSDYDDEEEDDEDDEDFAYNNNNNNKRRSSAVAGTSSSTLARPGSACNLDLSYDLNRKIDPIFNSTTLSTSASYQNTSRSNHDISMLNEAMCNDTIAVTAHNHHHSTPLTSNSINSIDNYARGVAVIGVNTSPKSTGRSGGTARALTVINLDDTDDTFTSSSDAIKPTGSKPKLTRSSQINR